MASELIQNKSVQRKAVKRSEDFWGRIELTRHQAFLDGQTDIFDILSRGNKTEINKQERVDIYERLSALEEFSELDPVTHIPNSKGFSRALVREIARTNRGLNEGGILVIFSIENYSAILRDYSQEAGDTAARLIARALESEIRDMDLAARIADDEFVLLFSDTSMSSALSRLQHMALRLNRLSLIWDGKEIRLNLSLGLKSYQHGAQPEEVFKEASADLKRNRHHETKKDACCKD